jgi:haloacid dehalogenase superfamily, subfamily IA, variant 1 with third motif having Dx(3-4)D or Dx(3-4)E
MKSSIKADQLLELHQSGVPLIFDLDDTIYNELDFLKRAYESICKEIFKDSWSQPHRYLIETFCSEGREKIFQKLFLKYPNSNYDENDCLNILRTSVFKQKLELTNWFSSFLSCVERPFHLRIITNGNPMQQRNKVKSLKIDWSLIDLELVCANEIKKKPDPASFLSLNNSENLSRAIYIGDSKIDREFSDNVGIRFLHTKNEISNFSL